MGGETLVLDLPAGPYLRVAATDVVLTIAGQTLTADVAFEQATDDTDAPVTVLAVNNLELEPGGRCHPAHRRSRSVRR